MADGLGGWIDCQGSSMKMSEKEKAQIKKAFSNGYTQIYNFDKNCTVPEQGSEITFSNTEYIADGIGGYHFSSNLKPAYLDLDVAAWLNGLFASNLNAVEVDSDPNPESQTTRSTMISTLSSKVETSTRFLQSEGKGGFSDMKKGDNVQLGEEEYFYDGVGGFTDKDGNKVDLSELIKASAGENPHLTPTKKHSMQKEFVSEVTESPRYDSQAQRLLTLQLQIETLEREIENNHKAKERLELGVQEKQDLVIEKEDQLKVKNKEIKQIKSDLESRDSQVRQL